MVAIAVRRTKTVTKQEDGRLLISVTISVVHHYECRQIWQDDTEVAMWIRSRQDKCATWTWTSSCHGIAVYSIHRTSMQHGHPCLRKK